MLVTAVLSSGGMMLPAHTACAQQPDTQGAVAVGEFPAIDRRAMDALLAHRVTVNLISVSRKEAIDALSKEASVPLLYRMTTLDKYPGFVTLHVSNVTLGSALDRVLDGTKLRVVPDGAEHLMVVDAASGVLMDSIPHGILTVTVVDSASGRALSGATVQIQGTRQQAITVANGGFVFGMAPTGEQVVIVRLFGYRPTRRVVTVKPLEATGVRIALAPAPNVLTGVVTTATGVQERRAIGNDITVINADSVLRVAPVKNVTDLLETRVPGLTVQRTSGVPGAPARLRLRGIGGGLIDGASNTSNDPIVVVDGVRVYARQSTTRDQNQAPPPQAGPYTAIGLYSSDYPTPSALDQIDVNSIETIAVFKGPSATAQWGSDAGNGVIVVTTKKGRAGPAQVSGTVDYGTVSMPGQYASPGYYVFGRPYGGGGSALCPGLGDLGGPCQIVDSIVPFQALDASRLSVFGRGHNEGVSATVSGGSTALTYALTGSASSSLGYLKMPSMVEEIYTTHYGEGPPQWMRRPDRYKQWAGNGTFGATPTVGMRVTYVTSLSNSAQQQSSGNGQLAALSGGYLDTVAVKASTFLGLRLAAPYFQKVTSDATTTTHTLQGDWSRWTLLTAQAVVGQSTANRVDRVEVPYGWPRNLSLTDTLGYYSTGRGTAETRTGTVTATALSGRRVTVAAGVQAVQQSTEDFQAFQDTLTPGVTRPTTFRASGENSYASTTAGWFIDPRLNFSSRFFVSPGFRLDGGSASTQRGSAKSGVLSLFPKINISWIALDREGLAPLGGILTLLRPRVAFGVAGVQPDPAWNLRLMQGGAGGLTLSSLGNTQLRPERSRELEGGFDAQFWGTRVTLTASAYRKMRLDAIEPISAAPSVIGGASYFTNIGHVRNTGTELSADVTVFDGTMVRWGMRASYSANRNTLTKRSSELPAIDPILKTPLFVVGYPLDARWERPIVSYTDADGDGMLQRSDIALGDSAAYMGSGQPKYTLPFGTDLSLWKGQISLTAGFEYVNGITQVNAGQEALLRTMYFNPNATLAEQAAALAATSIPSYPVSHFGIIQTVSTLRFQSLSVNYAVPTSFTRRVRLPAASVALQGSNLGLWTNYRGKDPDVNASTTGELISDTGQLPLPRTWGVRITLRN